MKKERALEKKLDFVFRSVERVYPTIPVLLMRSFLTGLFTAIGATVGLSMVVTIVTFTLQKLNVIPPLNFLINQTQIEEFISPNNE